MIPTETRSTVALTRGQKTELIEGCVLPALVIALVGGYVVATILGVVPYPPLLALVIIIGVLVIVGYQITQLIRDVSSGVALVEEDLLIKAWKAGAISSDLFGKFERLGTLSLKEKSVNLPTENIRYLVTYSPASKTAWFMQPRGEASPERMS